MSHRCRVYTNPDGSLRVLQPALKSRRVLSRVLLPGEAIPDGARALTAEDGSVMVFWDEPEDEWYARICARAIEADPTLAGLPFHDALDTDLPDRASRHAWRVKNGRVHVDPTIPKPETPAERRRARIAAATTLDELKAILLEG